MTSSLTRDPSTGGYGVVDLSGWFPWCIRHLTRSQWAHAFIVLDATAGTILEARPSGSAIGNLSQYAGRPKLFSEPAPEAGKAGGAQGLIEQVRETWTGIEYGFADIAELGLWYSVDIRPEWLTKLVISEHRMICSQLVAEWGDTYGADWNCGQADPQFVTPGLLGARLTG